MATKSATVSCPSCGVALPPDPRFCPQCGTRLDAGETLELPPEPVVPDPPTATGAARAQAPTTVHQVHREPLGMHPVPLLGGLGSLALLVAIILLAAGSIVGGLILLGVASLLFTLFLAGIRREPDAPAAQPTRRAIDRSRSLARLGAVSVHAWVRAGASLLRIRRRQHRLRSELQDRLKPLGEAVYRGDEERAQELKRQAAQLEERLREAEREASALITSTRHEIEQERATSAPTEAIAFGRAKEPGSPPDPGGR